MSSEIFCFELGGGSNQILNHIFEMKNITSRNHVNRNLYKIHIFKKRFENFDFTQLFLYEYTSSNLYVLTVCWKNKWHTVMNLMFWYITNMTHTTKFVSNQEIKQLLLDLLIRKTSVACQNIKIFLPVKIEDFALWLLNMNTRFC